MGEESLGFVLIGAGGHARVLAEAIAPRRVTGHVAPIAGEHAGLGPWLGNDDVLGNLVEQGYRFLIGVGFVDREGARRRASLVHHVRSQLVAVQHPRAVVSPSATIGDGAFVGAGAVVGHSAVIGPASIVNSGAIVDHDSHVGANCHIGPGAVLSGSVKVGDDTLVGVGACVIQGLALGRNVIIGAGAAVTADVPDGQTSVGVPARTLPSRGS